MSNTATSRVLVCDDERGLREMLRVLLRRAGHDVTVVEGVRDALACLRAGILANRDNMPNNGGLAGLMA